MPQIKGDEIFEGRGDEIHVFPLSFSEYYAFEQGEKGDAYDDYSVYGGLPAVALITTEEQKTNYFYTNESKKNSQYNEFCSWDDYMRYNG